MPHTPSGRSGIGRLIDKELTVPFSENDLRLLVNDKDAERPAAVTVPIVDYSKLGQLSDISQVFGPQGMAILYWRTRPKFGHWTCLLTYKRAGRRVVEHFDPLGMRVDELLTHLSPEFRRASGQDTPHLSLLLRRAQDGGAEILNSGSRLQNVRDADTNSCGRWVGLRLCFHQKGVTLAEFQACFGAGRASGAAMTPDKWAAALTAFVR